MDDNNFPKDTDQLFMEELKQEFMETVSVNLVDIAALYREKDFEAIARIAHDIKGTSGIFGYDEGTEIAKELQYAAQEKEDQKTGDLIEKLTRYMKEQGVIK